MRLLLISIVAVLAGCASVSRPPLPPPPTIDEIVQMSKDHVAAEDIIQRMHESRAVYRLSGSELADLKLRGVPDPVIDYMYNSRIAAERYEEYLQTRDQYMFYGWPGYGPWGPWGPWGAWGPSPYWYGPHHRR